MCSDVRVTWLSKHQSSLIVRGVRYMDTRLGGPIVVKHINGETPMTVPQATSPGIALTPA